jgi:hypothetical protein
MSNGKIIVLILFVFLNIICRAQDNMDLSILLKNQGFNFSTESISNSGNFFTGLLPDSKTLLVAKSEVGDYPLSEKIEIENGEGAFRPTEISKNEYIYYSFLDVSSIIQSEVHIQPRSSHNKRKRNQYSDRRKSGFLNGDPLMTCSSNSFQTQLSLASSNDYISDLKPNNISQYNYRFSKQPSFVFALNDEVVCFSQGVEKVSVINLSGDVLSSNEVITTKPLISSNKGRTILHDKSTGNFYLVVETNFSYNFYLINVKSGEANYLFKTDSVWENPNWKINDGILTYSKTNKGISKEFAQKL